MRVERLSREYPIDIDWVPFELHPQTPLEGTSYAAPPGSQRAAMGDYLKKLAAAEGLTLQRGGRISNSRLALEAGEFARAAGAEQFGRFHRALFRAYFEAGRDLGERAELLRLGAEALLDEEALALALDGRSFAPRVDAWTAWARERGIASTPTFVFDNRFALTGAQDDTVFADITRRMLARKAAEAASADTSLA